MVEAMAKVLRRERNSGSGKRPVRPLVLVLAALAIGGLWLAWVSGGPVPMRTITQEVAGASTAGQAATGQVKP